MCGGYLHRLNFVQQLLFRFLVEFLELLELFGGFVRLLLFEIVAFLRFPLIEQSVPADFVAPTKPAGRSLVFD